MTGWNAHRIGRRLGATCRPVRVGQALTFCACGRYRPAMYPCGGLVAIAELLFGWLLLEGGSHE